MLNWMPTKTTRIESITIKTATLTQAEWLETVLTEEGYSAKALALSDTNSMLVCSVQAQGRAQWLLANFGGL
jgi:hypothetical protein